ncbi:MAG: aminopeptidase, partial [Lachnospiraceae bacterium]|nr:aminopeptidase [Lachnospiraceae bacterium]
LAIHGVVAKKDGSVVTIAIGEEEDDPIFCVTDLLIHLSAEQLEKKARVVIEGEALDVLAGSRPFLAEEDGSKGADSKREEAGSKAFDNKKEAVKAFALEILKEKYDMDEEDFLSAELEVVPAWKARDLGFDRSMIAGYGQDDRICAFTSLAAMLDVENPVYTTCCLLVDKEEIGSVGATGMHSRFFENTIAELLACLGGGHYLDLDLRNALRRSKMFSCDVAAAYDPLYGAAFEKKNSAYLGRGLVFNKYTGSRGKSHANDANAEYIAWIRKVLDENDVCFQTAEVGKVDQGGGGTIAYISSVYGMDIIDGGVAILSMHAPLEVASKADIYEAKKGYAAFLRS